MNRKLARLISIAGLALVALMPTEVPARGVTPYLPLNMSPEIERQVERVLILAGKPVMTRPIPVAAVADALNDACKADEDLCEQVGRYLKRYAISADLTHLRAEIAVDSGDSDHAIPNQHGMNVDSSWQVSAEAYIQPSDFLLINLGGIAYDGRATPTGSMVSLGFEYAQLDIGYRDHWLSPFTDSSILISTEAPTMPSITLSNYQPISLLGLSYQVYLAEMSEASHIAYQNRYTIGNPRLAGLHLQMEPVKGFSFALNRQLQYGGGEREKDSFNDFLKALWQPGKYDNTSSDLTSDQEYGNQQASLTSRMIFPGSFPFSVYFEYAGEDTSRRKNYLLGNVSFSMGVDIPILWDNFNLTYEATEWQNGWYVHGVYKDGLTNNGDVIGHWFGDQRRLNDGTNGTSHMFRLGWQTGRGDFIEARYRTLKNDSYTSIKYKRMQELGLSYSFPWSGQSVGLDLYAGSDVYGDRYLRLGTSLEFGQDWMTIADVIQTSSDNSDDSTDLILDIGMNYSRIESDIGNSNNDSDKNNSDGDIHLGFGVSHAVSGNGDLGVRVEWDRITGHDLLSLRVMDYRCRIGNRFALNGFLGIGRYDLGIPAYGYYLGAGAQLLNILPRMDLCVDLRKHIEMERDKVLLSANSRPDEFYNVIGATLYLSRHF